MGMYTARAVLSERASETIVKSVQELIDQRAGAVAATAPADVKAEKKEPATD